MSAQSGMFLRLLRVDMLRFWRNTQSRYFTLLLPIIFLVIFAAIFKGETVVAGHKITIGTFYVPGIMTLGIVSACYLNLSVLPLYFISGVFVPEQQIPEVLTKIAEIFPIYHLAVVLREPFLESSGSLRLGDLAFVAAWGAASLVIAARTFRWTPAAEG